jgi:integrase
MKGQGKHKFHFTDNLPADPAIQRWREWSCENKLFHQGFLRWLAESGFSESARNIYSVASRQAMGFWRKRYWAIDPDQDLPAFWEHLQTRGLTPASLAGYHKGLKKWEEYWRLRCQKPPRPKVIDWGHYLGQLPEEMAQDMKAYVAHCARGWVPQRAHERSLDAISRLTKFMRLVVGRYPLRGTQDLTPDIWYAYVDERLQAGILPSTINDGMHELHHFLHFLQDLEKPICARLLLTDMLHEGQRLPRDVPADRLRRLFQEIQAEATSYHRFKARCGRMDLAWFLLMLHSGLRTCEVRALRFEQMDLEHRRIRIEQSKGLKDRVVFLTEASVAALQSYLEVRGPRAELPPQVFIYAHKPLSRMYCCGRLRRYGRRSGVTVTPHQLRHSCATLLLNAGAPVLTVKMLLGHKFVDITLGYARLYDGTVAAGYYGAMGEVERRLELTGIAEQATPNPAELIALVDGLSSGVLDPSQAAAVQALREGLLALTRIELAKQNIGDVKEPAVRKEEKTE